MDDAHVQPWFAGTSGTLLLYKVNRRPFPQGNIFAKQPENVLDHFTEALLFGAPVTTGRKVSRMWRLGNREIDLVAHKLSGHIGWIREDAETHDAYDAIKIQWRDRVFPKEVTARSVFVFDAVTRYLLVAQHSSFSSQNVRQVFVTLLNKGEQNREYPTTEWDVEPILDNESFRDWITKTAIVSKVKFVAKLPNPDGIENFPDVYARLEAMRAKKIEESVTARDPAVGLRGIEEDLIAKQYLEMAQMAFGYISAVGTNGSTETRYDQRDQGKRIFVQYPQTWNQLREMISNELNSLRDKNGIQ